MVIRIIINFILVVFLCVSVFITEAHPRPEGFNPKPTNWCLQLKNTGHIYDNGLYVCKVEIGDEEEYCYFNWPERGASMKIDCDDYDDEKYKEWRK